MSHRFSWDHWSYNGSRDAYIIAKDQCPERESVPDFIIKADGLDPACKPGIEVQEGWCKYQVRTDWEGDEGIPEGGYLVEEGSANRQGNKKKGWFQVWIVKGSWY